MSGAAARSTISQPRTQSTADMVVLPSTSVRRFAWSVFVLCRIKGFDGRSCHELFHLLSTALVDYCTSEMDAMVHVVPHRNRPPPPAHNAGVNARLNSSESDNDEDESPRRTRSRFTPVVTRLWRSFRSATRASKEDQPSELSIMVPTLLAELYASFWEK